MKKLELPKTCRFKKIPAKDSLLIHAGFASNRNWIFSIAWLESLKASRALGNGYLLRRVLKERSKAVIETLRGESYGGPDLEKFVSEYAAKPGYVPVSKPIKYFDGYLRGDPKNHDKAFVGFSNQGPFLDIEYAASLFFDSDSVQVYIAERAMPVLLKSKFSGELVGIIAALSPNSIAENIRKGKKS